MEIEGKGGWIIGWGQKGYVAPPLSNYWGAWPPGPPLPTPMILRFGKHTLCSNSTSSQPNINHLYFIEIFYHIQPQPHNDLWIYFFYQLG